jgi:hypothetical protein
VNAMRSHDHMHGARAGFSAEHPRPTAPAAEEARSGGSVPAPDWHGLTLVHRGSELGVVGHISREGAHSEAVLHAFGGISRSLEYAVPESAIAGVLGVSARALVDDAVEFQPRHLCGDGHVILAPRTRLEGGPAMDEQWQTLTATAWVGMHVYADDGYLGEVVTVLPADAEQPVEALIVRVRTWLWKARLAAIPLSRVVACTPREHLARVVGRRRELSKLPEDVARGG